MKSEDIKLDDSQLSLTYTQYARVILARQAQRKEEQLLEYGTASSGNRGHAGRPGAVGGSAPKDQVTGSRWFVGHGFSDDIENNPKLMRGMITATKGVWELQKKTNNEHLIILTEDGTDLCHIAGESDGVTIPRDLRSTLVGKHLIHSHPDIYTGGARTFSLDDILIAVTYNVKSITARTSTGSFFLSRTGPTWGTDRQVTSDAFKELTEAGMAVFYKEQLKIQKTDIKLSGSVVDSFASDRAYSFMIKELAKKFGWSYRFIPHEPKSAVRDWFEGN